MTQPPHDSHLAQNLDALNRDLEDLETLTAAALCDAPYDRNLLKQVDAEPGSLDYEDLTVHNRHRRDEHGWGHADIRSLLTVEQEAALSRWRERDRLQWAPEDLLAVGFAGAVGVMATVFDTRADTAVREGLGWLKSTRLLKQWEADATRMPIDYTGYKFGGASHRVRSAGHDVLRLAESLDQVRTGTFRGVYWQDGQKIAVELATNSYGKHFRTAASLSEAMALLVKHWAADAVTPMSLPLPGFSLLYELPSRDFRTFANEAYAGFELGRLGRGLNLRSGLITPSLSVVSVEVLLRSHVHLQAYEVSGKFTLDARMRRKRSEMLVAAQALTSAASLTKSAMMYSAYGPLALRHVNVPALIRTGSLALELHRTRSRQLDSFDRLSWEDLAAQELEELEESAIWHLAALLEQPPAPASTAPTSEGFPGSGA